MVMGAVTEVEKLSGPQRQLAPEEQQIVDGEPQTITQAPMPLVEVGEPEKRMAPLPVTITPVTEAAAAAAAPAMGAVFPGMPIVIANRYNGVDTAWQSLVRWDIPVGVMGDLHEISLISNDDAHTRYRVVIANQDMNLPTDRATTTPLSWPWQGTGIPGGLSIYVEVRSTDGTAIQVDGSITGTYKALPGG